MRTLLLGLALLALSRTTLAEVWEDPDLPAALASASLVIVGKAPPEGSRGEPRVRFQVERRIHGEGGLREVEVSGLHDPTATSGPSFEPGERVLFVLTRGPDGTLRTPTPTFGRFPLRGEQVLYAALRDTFLRLELPLVDYERFLLLALGRPAEEAWLEALLGHLRSSGPGETGPARARSYLALEALCLVGRGQGAGQELTATIARYLDPAGPFQLRISALRALAACGDNPLPALLSALERDPEPAVRTAAARLLARAGAASPPAGLVERLGGLLPTAPTQPVRFVGPTDPRTNSWPSPRVALLQAIAALGPAPARGALLSALDEPTQPGDALLATAEALGRLRDDRSLARELAGRLRGDGEPRDLALCRALAALTGLPHGEDAAAWKEWARAGR